MSPYPLTNLEIQKYYQNQPKSNSVYSRNNLLIIKDEAYVTNIDEYESIGTHWIALYVKGNNILIPLELNIFQKKFKRTYSRKKSKETKKQQQIFIEHKQIIGLCVDTFVMDLSIL